ncbi:hypothetical protein K7J14_08380 [Treponema zuelzerae]|uniref:Uncharacterized protein n=1 Tax=Teretinema zuelzerae TaxID=156 RepID=A0AAE3EHY2_9SPIR|nr:hypothetical protein [Teretinema zuelzerae]MCD1654721.1 hypothetical protein [Teretinema zuelzerae]
MAALVTASAIKDFSAIFPETDSIVNECEASAEDIVTEYLGFHPVKKGYTHDVVGLGDGNLYLQAFPVSGSITVDGTIYESGSFDLNQNIVTIRDTTFTFKSRIPVSYEAGFETVPDSILHVILQIASLLLTERGKVGISGYSDQNTGSRTFISYSNFDRYLKNIKKYKLFKALV